MQIWVNGTLEKSCDPDTDGISYGTPNGFQIGYSRYGAGADGGWFNGTIDEVRVWNRALTQSEITAVYQAGNVSTLGSATYTNAPPIITIFSPANTTYYTTAITQNFKATDAESATFALKMWDDNVLTYNSAAYANNTNQTYSPTKTGGQHNITIWANDSAGNIVTSTVLYYVWMGLNVSAFNNATSAQMSNWSITATNGTFAYTNASQNNPSLIEWSLLPQGSVNITVDDNSTTLYFYNTTYSRTLNNSALVQLNAYLQPKSNNPVSLTSSAGWSMTQGYSTTITCTASELTPQFQISGVGVTSPYSLTTQAGTYTAICNALTETTNYAPVNVSNILLVNPLISCTNTNTFAFSLNVTTATNITTLNFTTLVGQNLVRSNLGDVSVPAAISTWTNTTNGYYVIVNNTGNLTFTVNFGNYYANVSHSSASLQGNISNIAGYTQVNPYTIYNILDELTGTPMFPPNATLTSIIHCSLGETYIPIDDNTTKLLIASQAYLDKASLRVLYTADAYYSRQLYPAPANALVLNFYVIDAMKTALDRIDFLMQDINYYGSKLQLYKLVNNETLIVTEGYFDAAHYFSAYLLEDSDYLMRTESPSSDFGRITVVAPTTKDLGNVQMSLNPQATLISDNILENSWTDANRTTMYITYLDKTNKTNNVTITAYFENGTVFQNQTYYTNSVSVNYNISAYSNESFTVEFLLWHQQFGNSPVAYTQSLNAGALIDAGLDSSVYALISLGILMLIGGTITKQLIVAGSGMLMFAIILLYAIGWLPLTLLKIVGVAVLLIIGIIVYHKEGGQ